MKQSWSPAVFPLRDQRNLPHGILHFGAALWGTPDGTSTQNPPAVDPSRDTAMLGSNELDASKTNPELYIPDFSKAWALGKVEM